MVTIYSQRMAFAAVHSDGSISTWGMNFCNHQGQCGVSTPVPGFNLVSATQNAVLHAPFATIVGHERGFSSLLTDGTVFDWGEYYGSNTPDDGGGIGPPAAVTSDVTSGATAPVVQLATMSRAVIALHEDGVVSAWGSGWGVSADPLPSTVTSGLNPVVRIATTVTAWVALHVDGSVSEWGGSADGAYNAGLPPASVTGGGDGHPVVGIASGVVSFVALIDVPPPPPRPPPWPPLLPPAPPPLPPPPQICGTSSAACGDDVCTNANPHCRCCYHGNNGNPNPPENCAVSNTTPPQRFERRSPLSAAPLLQLLLKCVGC